MDWWSRVIRANKQYLHTKRSLREWIKILEIPIPEEVFDKVQFMSDNDIHRLSLILNIEINFKLNKIMGQIEDILQSEQDENSALKALAQGVTNLASALAGAQNQLGALQTQLNSGTAVSKDQLQSLADGIASGRQIATDALAQAEAALAAQPASSAGSTTGGTDTTTT